MARRLVDELTVVVDRLDDAPIPGAVRVAWLAEMFPTVRVVELDRPCPQAPSEHPHFWEVWRQALLSTLGHAPDVVFASEAYGVTLAEALGARFVPVDPRRDAHPISGTALRAAPLAHWAAIPRVVRPWFVRRVSVFGPESTGKSTLARELAARFCTTWVPEHARAILEAKGGVCEAGDLPAIARGQAACEDALARDANRLLVCDTNPLATVVWSEALFGACDATVLAIAAARRYDLTLLLDADVPFVPDPVRYLPHARRDFFERCVRALEAHGRPYVIVRGSFEARLADAVSATQRLLETVA